MTKKRPRRDRTHQVVLDRETGIVMINIKAGGRRKWKTGKTTREVAHGWVVDFDENGEPEQIELLYPSKVFPEEILKLLPPEFLEDDK